MPNNKYLRSVKRERELVNQARKLGKIAARTAGSKSPIDVFIVDHVNKVMECIQVKTKKGKRKPVVKNAEEYLGYKLRIYTMSWER